MRAEQKTAYGTRMEKMYKRLAKHALDPDNKAEYLAREKDWHTYAEKWQKYHEKQLEKAGESGIIKESQIPIKRTTSVSESTKTASAISETEDIAKSTDTTVDYSDVGSKAFSSENRQSMLEAERIISGNRYETAIIYDSDGNMLFSQKGIANEVQFSAKQLKQMRGCTVTHNHPHGTVFSAEDIEIMRKAQIVELRACNHHGSYVIRTKGEWHSEISNYKSIRKSYDKCMIQAENQVLDELAAEGRRITRRDFQRMNENGMELFCKQYGLEFSWEDKVV